MSDETNDPEAPEASAPASASIAPPECDPMGPAPPTKRLCEIRAKLWKAYQAGVTDPDQLRAIVRCNLQTVYWIVRKGMPQYGWPPFEGGVSRPRPPRPTTPTINPLDPSGPPVDLPPARKPKEHVVVERKAEIIAAQMASANITAAINSWADARARALNSLGQTMDLAQKVLERMAEVVPQLGLASFVKYRTVTGTDGKDQRVAYVDGPAFLICLQRLAGIMNTATASTSFVLGGPSARVENTLGLTPEQEQYMEETGQLPEGVTPEQIARALMAIQTANTPPS